MGTDCILRAFSFDVYRGATGYELASHAGALSAGAVAAECGGRPGGVGAEAGEWHVGAYYLLVLGAVGAVVAVLSGTEAAASYRSDAEVLEHIERHEDLSTLVLFFFLVVALGRLPLHLQGRLQGRALKAWILAAGVGCGLLWQTGLYGGELVYRYGVGVAQEARKSADPVGSGRSISPPALPAE